MVFPRCGLRNLLTSDTSLRQFGAPADFMDSPQQCCSKKANGLFEANIPHLERRSLPPRTAEYSCRWILGFREQPAEVSAEIWTVVLPLNRLKRSDLRLSCPTRQLCSL